MKKNFGDLWEVLHYGIYQHSDRSLVAAQKGEGGKFRFFFWWEWGTKKELKKLIDLIIYLFGQYSFIYLKNETFSIKILLSYMHPPVLFSICIYLFSFLCQKPLLKIRATADAWLRWGFPVTQRLCCETSWEAKGTCLLLSGSLREHSFHLDRYLSSVSLPRGLTRLLGRSRTKED